MSEVLMKGMLKDEDEDEMKARSGRNELNGSCWCVRPLDPTYSPGGCGKKKKKEEKGE